MSLNITSNKGDLLAKEIFCKYSAPYLSSGLTCLLESLDKLNRKAPAFDKEETDDLLWQGSSGRKGYHYTDETSER